MTNMIVKTIGLACIAAFTSATQIGAKPWDSFISDSINVAAQVSNSAGQLNDEQREILYDLFNEARATDARVQYPVFVTLMREHGVTSHPQTTGCDPDRCDFCKNGADTMGGWCQHYTAQGADMGGTKGLTYTQFLKALESVSTQDANAYEELTYDRIADHLLRSATYQHILLFSNEGDGGAGKFSQTTTYDIGRSDARQTSESTKNKMHAGVKAGATAGPVGISVEASTKYSNEFGSTVDSAKNSETKTTDKLVMNLIKPNNVYQRVIVLEYASGRRETVKGKLLFSNVPEPFKKKVSYAEDGSILDTQVTPF